MSSNFEHAHEEFFVISAHTLVAADASGGDMARFVKDDETADIAWKMFEQTGSLSYYMLYKQLKK